MLFRSNGGDTANPEVGGTGLAWSANNNGGDGPSGTSVLVHTVPENSWDEVYLWASNINSSEGTSPEFRVCSVVIHLYLMSPINCHNVAARKFFLSKQENYFPGF